MPERPEGSLAEGGLIEDLSVPYALHVSSVEHDGRWVRRAAYPELPGAVAESTNTMDAIRRLDERKVEILVAMRRRGESPPRPRPPLSSGQILGGHQLAERALRSLYLGYLGGEPDPLDDPPLGGSPAGERG